MRIENLGKYISEVSIRNKKMGVTDVFSVTNSQGFVKSTDYFSKEVFSKDISNYKIVSENQFAYNPSRVNVGSIDYLTQNSKVVISPLYVVFECDKELNEEYLKVFLKSPIGNARIRAKTKGTVRDTLSFSSLCEIKIPILPFAAQLHIANLLSKAETLISQRKESIRLLNEFLKSTFLELFGNAVENQKNWEKTELKNYAKVRIGPFGSLLHREDYVHNGMPLVNPSHIGEGKIIIDPELTISKAKMKELYAYVMREGDVVLGRRGEIGRCAVVTKKEDGYLCGTGSIYIRPKVELNPIFLYSIISSASMRKVLENSAKGITMKNLNSGIIENLKIPVPPIQLQTQFAQIVKKTEALKTQYRQSLQELENLYGSLSQKAFRGELEEKMSEL